MPDILIRGLSARAIQQLRVRAKRQGRSLHGEAKVVLEQAAGASGDEIAAMLARWQRRFAGRRFSSSVDMIRQDRAR